MSEKALSVAERIRLELSQWPGVVVSPHRFGGMEFRLGRRELGHLHGNRLADLPFPRRVRDELVARGQASPHHVLPQSGWVSVHIRGEQDVATVIDLFRLNYERAIESGSRDKSDSRDVSGSRDVARNDQGPASESRERRR